MNGKRPLKWIPNGCRYAHIVLGRKLKLNAFPPLAARKSRRCALTLAQTWSAMGSPMGMPNFA